MNPRYDIPTYKEEETELYKCCISEDLLEREEVYYNIFPGEYFRKDLIDKYIDSLELDLTFCERQKFKQVLISEDQRIYKIHY